MPVESHVLKDGALHGYRRENSRFWQCSTYLGSHSHRQTTKDVSLAAAKDFARDWYMERCVEDRQRRRGGAPLLDGTVQLSVAGPGAPTDGRRRRTPTGPSFADAADAFTREFGVITLGERNRIREAEVRPRPCPPPAVFRQDSAGDINAGTVQEYRVHRQTSRVDPKTGKPKKPARATLHGEVVTLRQVLKTAHRKGWIDALPDMSAPEEQYRRFGRQHPQGAT